MNMKISMGPWFNRVKDALASSERRNVFSLVAEDMVKLVQGHMRSLASSRHTWADRLGGTATKHYDVAGSIGSNFDANHAEVIIPVAGLNRAFHDVTIEPKRWTHLTLPIHGAAYGHRVAELRRMGWPVIFRPAAKGSKMTSAKGEKPRKFSAYKDVLMGHKAGDKELVPLYILKKRVQQRQDRTLLPSDREINATVSGAIAKAIRASMAKAG